MSVETTGFCMYSSEKTLVLFDGVCNLCESSVIFLIKHDRLDQCRFASIQSAFGVSVLNYYKIPENERLNSFFVVERNRLYSKSGAWRILLAKMAFPFNLLQYFLWLPAVLTDKVYDFIGRRRYRWFGKKDYCLLPSEQLKQKFIEDENLND